MPSEESPAIVLRGDYQRPGSEGWELVSIHVPDHSRLELPSIWVKRRMEESGRLAISSVTVNSGFRLENQATPAEWE